MERWGGCLKCLEKNKGEKISLNFELKNNGELVYEIPKHINARIDIEIELLFSRPFCI